MAGDADEELVNLNDEGEGGGGGKAPRLPRWTRQEILVLIRGKRVAEGRVRRGRVACEPKWATVSSYCKRHGVNRGAVQCRKRWSNLSGDFKKIKEWESQIKEEEEADSFWVMRSDFRRDRKLPGFFDKEVYDILEMDHHNHNNNNNDIDNDGSPPPPIDPVFDSGRSAAADDALFSDPLPLPSPPSAIPISEKVECQPFTITTALLTDSGKNEEAAVNPEIGSTSDELEGRKRRRRFVEEEEEEEEEETEEAELKKVLERNGRILNTQLKAHNMNLKLDREERKKHATALVAVLNKLADALGRIADKL